MQAGEKHKNCSSSALEEEKATAACKGGHSFSSPSSCTPSKQSIHLRERERERGRIKWYKLSPCLPPFLRSMDQIQGQPKTGKRIKQLQEKLAYGPALGQHDVPPPPQARRQEASPWQKEAAVKRTKKIKTILCFGFWRSKMHACGESTLLPLCFNFSSFLLQSLLPLSVGLFCWSTTVFAQ